MITQVWISIREDFAFPADDPELDTELQAKNREALSRATDIDVVPLLFKQETQAGKQWTLYIFTYDFELPRETEQAVERLASENPGQTRELGGWDWDGKMFGEEWAYDQDGNITGTTGVPLYPLYGNLLSYMPDVNGVPATEVTDVNILLGQTPRRFV